MTAKSKDVSEKPFLLSARFWNIGCRTMHIAVAGVLLGGHVFAVSRDRLVLWLFATILTGLLLTWLEAKSGLRWFHQGRGLFVLSKMALLCLIPWFWDLRVPILFIVVAIGSFGSHMPARFRYYSVVYRRVL